MLLLLCTNTQSCLAATSHYSVVLQETVNHPMSWLRQLQLQLIYTVATHHRALFPATPLLLNVIKKYVMKADKLFKSLPVSLGSVAQLHAADATENCQKDQNNSFP